MLLLWLVASDAWCTEINAAPLQEPIAIGPMVCPKAQKAACDAFATSLVRCLGKRKVVTDTGAQIALSEKALSALYKGGTDDLQQMGRALAAKQIVVTQVQPNDKTVIALVRVVNVEDGQIVALARTVLSGESKVADKDYRSATARLAQGLAQGYLSTPGKSKRVAVMPLVETGEQSKKNGLGTLVAAELITLLRRDWGVQVVERSRLADVMKEIELGQYGAVNAKMAPKIGNLLNADAIILGTVSDAGAAIAVNAQVIDTTTALTINAESVQMQAASLISLSADAVVLRSKSGALFRSLLIPGWGQMYNRQPIKGGVFLGSALALAGAGATMFVLGGAAANTYNHAGPGANFDALAGRVTTFNIAGTAILSGLALFWVVNIIDAYVNGVTFDSAVASNGGME